MQHAIIRQPLFSTFNPEAFLGQQVTEAHETRMVLVPEGTALGQIKSLNVRKLDATGDNPERYILAIQWAVLDDEVKRITGLNEPTVPQDIWLDTNASGGLESGPGKNVSLGRLREAVGQNKPGKAWAMSHLNGALANLIIKHEVSKKDGETYAKAVKVSPQN